MSNQKNTVDAVAKELAVLGPLRELSDEVLTYPVRLLTLVCEEFDRRQSAVPDHALKLLPYLGETALRALVAGGYVERVDDVSYAISAYAPTELGRATAARASAAPLPPKRTSRKRT
jgi:hypothetical protein